MSLFYRIDSDGSCVYSGSTFSGATEVTTANNFLKNNSAIKFFNPLEGGTAVTSLTAGEQFLAYCPNLEQADLSGIQINNVNMTRWLESCPNIKNVTMPNSYTYNTSWSPLRLSGSSNIELSISNCGALLNRLCTKINHKGVTIIARSDVHPNNLDSTFYDSDNLEIVNLAGLNPTENSTVTMNQAMAHCSKIKQIVFPDTPATYDCGAYYMLNASGQATDTLKLSGCIKGTMSGWFRGSNYKGFDFSELTTIDVTNLRDIFYNCDNLESVDLSVINFANSNIPCDMALAYCEKLEYVKLPNINHAPAVSSSFFSLSGDTDMTLVVEGGGNKWANLAYMFKNSRYKVIDISGFEWGVVTNINEMFYNCTNLTTIISKEDIYVSGVANYSNTFFNDSNLVGGQGSEFTNASGEHAIIDDGENGGYLTQWVSPDRLDVVLVPVNCATYEILDLGDIEGTDYHEWNLKVYPAEGYTFNRIEAQFTESTTITYKTPTPPNFIMTKGVHIVTVYCESEHDPYDPVTPIPDLPSDTITPIVPTDYIEQYTTSGFYKIFIPTASQLQTFVSYLYSSDFTTALKNLWDRIVPIDDLIAGVTIMPCTETVPAIAGAQEPKVGWVSATIGDHSMNYTNDQYITIDMGSLTINRAWGNYLDYSPYTTVSIYLPFIGVRSLEPNDVMGKTISLSYTIDLLSGNCVALIKIGDSVHYQFAGNCAYSIPISTADVGNAMLQPLKALTGVGLAVAGIATGNPMLVGAGAGTMGASVSGNAEGGTEIEGLGSAVQGSISEAKKSGVSPIDSLTANTGYMGINYPYIFIERVVPDIPNGFGKLHGYQSNKYAQLINLTGYTKMLDVHIVNTSATAVERNEIEKLLKGGVIL